jgi:hypothetical protein
VKKICLGLVLVGVRFLVLGPLLKMFCKIFNQLTSYPRIRTAGSHMPKPRRTEEHWLLVIITYKLSALKDAFILGVKDSSIKSLRPS